MLFYGDLRGYSSFESRISEVLSRPLTLKMQLKVWLPGWFTSSRAPNDASGTHPCVVNKNNCSYTSFGRILHNSS